MIRTKKNLRRIAEIRDNLDDMSDALRDEIYVILKSSKDRTVSAAAIQTLYLAQIKFEGAPILLFGEINQALQSKYENDSSYLYVLDIFHVKEKGVVVTGYVMGEGIAINDALSLEKADGRNLTATCIDISEHPSRVSHIQLSGLALSEISQGDRLVKI